jgi:hypothetical protein
MATQRPRDLGWSEQVAPLRVDPAAGLGARQLPPGDVSDDHVITGLVLVPRHQ